MNKALPHPAGSPPKLRPVGSQGNVGPLRRWLQEGLTGLGPGSVILAIGTTDALLAPLLLEFAPEVTVLETENGDMTSLGRRFPEITFLPHDAASRLPFARGTFDAVWCCDILDRVTDPAALMRDMHRALASGGRLLVSVRDHDRIHQVLSTFFPWEPPVAAARRRLRSFTADALARAAREVGFGEIDTETHAVGRRDGGALRRHLRLRARKGPVLDPVKAEGVFLDDRASARRARAA